MANSRVWQIRMHRQSALASILAVIMVWSQTEMIQFKEGRRKGQVCCPRIITRILSPLSRDISPSLALTWNNTPLFERRFWFFLILPQGRIVSQVSRCSLTTPSLPNRGMLIGEHERREDNTAAAFTARLRGARHSAGRNRWHVGGAYLDDWSEPTPPILDFRSTIARGREGERTQTAAGFPSEAAHVWPFA